MNDRIEEYRLKRVQAQQDVERYNHIIADLEQEELKNNLKPGQKVWATVKRWRGVEKRQWGLDRPDTFRGRFVVDVSGNLLSIDHHAPFAIGKLCFGYVKDLKV